MKNKNKNNREWRVKAGGKPLIGIKNKIRSCSESFLVKLKEVDQKEKFSKFCPFSSLELWNQKYAFKIDVFFSFLFFFNIIFEFLLYFLYLYKLPPVIFGVNKIDSIKIYWFWSGLFWIQISKRKTNSKIFGFIFLISKI